MDNRQKYNAIMNEGLRMTSFMGAIANNESPKFSVEQVESALKSSSYFQLLTFVQREPAPETECRFMAAANLLYKNTLYEVELTVEPTTSINFSEFGFGNYVANAELETASLQTEYLSCAVNYNGRAIDDFLFQLKVLHAVVPNTSVVIDFMSWCLLSGQWLRVTAPSLIPPSPDYLYSIHAVHNDDGNSRSYWLHTHGLLRCGSVELEMVDLHIGVEHLAQLLRVTANIFLENIPNENEEFSVGYDGLEMKLCWRRWEEVVKTLPPDTSGGIQDHKNEDMGEEPAGVIFASQDGEACSPEIYVSALKKDPLLFFTKEETKRMSLMAKERYPIFKDTFTRYGSTSGWKFYVKLGYKTNDKEKERKTEHLWFQVLAVEGDKLYAELTDSPYWIEQLKKGDKRFHDIHLLTDWFICPPDTTAEAYTPDSIYQLYQTQSSMPPVEVKTLLEDTQRQ